MAASTLYDSDQHLVAAAALRGIGGTAARPTTLPASPSSSKLTGGKPRYTHHAPFESLVRDKPSQRAVYELCLQLRRGQLQGAEKVAIATAKVLRSVASAARFQSLHELIDTLKAAGRMLQNAQPREQSIGNITRRIVHLLREEARIAISESEQAASAAAPVTPSPSQSLSNSLAHLTLASSSLSPTAQSPQPLSHHHRPSHPAQSLAYPHSSSASSSSPVLSPGTGAHPLHAGSLSRPGPLPLRTDSAFVHGSFSISDLVAAGAMAVPSALATPADSSYASTPHGTLSRSGSGFFNQPSLHVPGGSHISQFSVTEDPDGEAMAEAEAEEERQDVHSDGEDAHDDDDEDEEEDDEEEDDDDDEGLVSSAAKKTSAAAATTSKKPDVGAYWLKPLVVQAIQEMLFELEEADENIAKDARDHIHSGEVILTLGYSRTTEAFFKAAAKDRKFTVIVAETAPLYTGHSLARSLSASGISTLLIPDSNVFAVMPRVSKLVLDAHAILANGGFLTSPGSLPAALGAQSHSTPIVVLAATFKLCPEWSGESLDDLISYQSQGSMGNEGSPAAVLDFAIAPAIVQSAEVVNPQWEYVNPELVDVYITNAGEHPPSYVYRLVKENYDELDLVL